MKPPFQTVLSRRVTADPLPFDQWPKWAKSVAWFKQPEDAGVGDTIKRMLGSAGILFEATMIALKAPCGCDRRKAEWNARFVYQ